MTVCRFRPGASKGYRYEVRCLDGAGKAFTVGWTNDPTGGALTKMVEQHPVWDAARVIDLQAPTDANGG